jgi:hypothetical protein
MNPYDRRWTVKLVHDTLRGLGLEGSNQDPMTTITDKFIVSYVDDICSRTDPMVPVAAAIDSHHAMSAIRVPLLLDSDGLVVSFLWSSIKPKRLIVVSQSISTLDAVITSAVCDGKTLILVDVDYLHPFVAPLLPLYLLTQDPNATKEIRVGSKIAIWDTRFRLILVSSTIHPLSLPTSLLSRVTLIDANPSSLVTTDASFENTFVEFFDPPLLPRIHEMWKAELSQRCRIGKYERDTIDIFSDIMTTQTTNPHYDYLTDEETFHDLIRSKECYFATLNVPIDFACLKEEVRTALQPFRGHIRLCQTFWEVMSRMLL